MGNLKKEVGERLEFLRKVKKWRKYELAEKTEIHNTHIRRYLSGEFDCIKLVNILYSAGHITKEENTWLLTGTGNKPMTDEELSEVESGFGGARPVYEYPILAEVYAGEPEDFDNEDYDDYYHFPYKKNNNRCFGLRVNGTSMETTLSSGDLVLCDMDAAVIDNCLVAIKLQNGKQFIKRYKDVNVTFIQLSSDNPNFDTRLVDKSDIVAIYRVVQSVRQH